MKYENGRDIFPERLFKQIQKYVFGKLVDIPTNDKKRMWGESSGYKQYLVERNPDIKAYYLDYRKKRARFLHIEVFAVFRTKLSCHINLFPYPSVT